MFFKSARSLNVLGVFDSHKQQHFFSFVSQEQKCLYRPEIFIIRGITRTRIYFNIILVKGMHIYRRGLTDKKNMLKFHNFLTWFFHPHPFVTESEIRVYKLFVVNIIQHMS